MSDVSSKGNKRPHHFVDFDLNSRSCALMGSDHVLNRLCPFCFSSLQLILYALPSILSKGSVRFFHFSLSFPHYLIISTGVQLGKGNNVDVNLDF